MDNPYGDNSILNGWHACNCALPAMNGGSTECCKHCSNRNRNLYDEWQEYWNGQKTIDLMPPGMQVIKDDENKIIVIIYNN